MTEVSEIIKRRLNESYESSVLKKFIDYARSYAKKNNKYYEIHFVMNGRSYDMINIKYDGELLKGTYRNALSGLTDDNIVSGNFYKHEDLFRVLKGQKAQWDTMVKMTQNRSYSFLLLVDYEEVKRNKSTEVAAAIIIEKNGTKQIFDAAKKSEERKDKKIIQIEKDPKKWTVAEWKDVYACIKKDYDEFKKTHGDKAALFLSKTVNSMMKDDRVKNVLRQQLRDGKDMTRFLYGFMLKRDDPYNFMDFMEKSKGLCNIRDEFYKRLEDK